MTMVKTLMISKSNVSLDGLWLLWPTLHHNELPSDLSSHRHALQPLCPGVQVALGEKKTSLRVLGK